MKCTNDKDCLSANDCLSGVCAGGKCKAPTCTDQVKNGFETDLDCGGPDCSDCPDTWACISNGDCLSGVCDTNACAAPTCVDQVKNGNETDKDCGGSCPACQDNFACTTASDCTSKICLQNSCKPPTCADMVKNGFETDVDCGGPECTDCSTGKGCNEAGDCLSRVCSGSNNDKFCLAATCSDSVKNGGETGIDCGGPDCADCPAGQGCNNGADCTSGVCGANKTCQVATCPDGVKNGGETGIDCGGPDCADCPAGQGCNNGADCTSGVCGANNTCQMATCSDSVKNGAETDIDCGGLACVGENKRCEDNRACSAGDDCQSGVCQNNECQAATCADGVKNGGETGIDCGNASCGPCRLLLAASNATNTVLGVFNADLSSPAWSVPETKTGFTSLAPDIAFTTTGVGVVAIRDEAAGSVARFARWTQGAGWADFVDINTTPIHSTPMLVSVGNSNTILAAWTQSQTVGMTTTGWVEFAQYDGASNSWNPSEENAHELAIAANTISPDITVLDTSTPYVVYVDDNDQGNKKSLFFRARGMGGVWTERLHAHRCSLVHVI